jgi:hypothetical protein
MQTLGARRDAINALVTLVRSPAKVIEQRFKPPSAHSIYPADEDGLLHRLTEAVQQSVQPVAPAIVGNVVGDKQRNGSEPVGGFQGCGGNGPVHGGGVEFMYRCNGRDVEIFKWHGAAPSCRRRLFEIHGVAAVVRT